MFLHLTFITNSLVEHYIYTVFVIIDKMFNKIQIPIKAQIKSLLICAFIGICL